jgi:purine-nucleoside phosphorylase
VSATPELAQLLMDVPADGVPRHAGPIWTTAALLAEGNAEIDAWHRQGYLAVDMETATTSGLAEWTGMQRVSILSVFDNPRQGAHIALTEHDQGGRSRRWRGGDAAAHARARPPVRVILAG